MYILSYPLFNSEGVINFNILFYYFENICKYLNYLVDKTRSFVGNRPIFESVFGYFV